MAPTLLVRTTAGSIPGMPPFLREIWAHLYPSCPPPEYRVYQDRPNGTSSVFTATVCLEFGPEPGANYLFRSRSVGKLTRAIQEAATEAVVLLRTVNPTMISCSRFTFFPAMEDGVVTFTMERDEQSPLSMLVRYTAIIQQYLSDSLLELDIARRELGTAEMARTVGIDLSFLDSPPPRSYLNRTRSGSSSRRRRIPRSRRTTTPFPRTRIRQATSVTDRYQPQFTRGSPIRVVSPRQHVQPDPFDMFVAPATPLFSPEYSADTSEEI